MYTSGWPKNQNRCCHRIGEPAARRRRRCGRRSGGRRTAWPPAAVSTGKAISTSTLVTSMFQVKIGIRNIVMPGARMVTTVAMMFTAVRMPESPVSTTPMIHRSPPSAGRAGLVATAARRRSSRSRRRRRR